MIKIIFYINIILHLIALKYSNINFVNIARPQHKIYCSPGTYGIERT